MKKLKLLLINMFNGFCMALADSVPGVSGGTIAFLLGFYDEFINSLDDLFRGNMDSKKKAFIFLIKLGLGWIIGFLLAATILSNMFTSKIYEMSSLFLGFIIFSIPQVIKEEKDSVKGHYKNIVFLILGAILVAGISYFTTHSSLGVDVNNLSLFNIIYIFFAAAIAITAMVLPGISGSTLLLIFGLYIPIIGAIKKFISFDFSVFPLLLVFGLGVLFGIVAFVRILKNCLNNHRSKTVYFILGMMVGSLYAIINGPTTLEVPMEMMTFKTFNILFFIIGALIIVLLEVLKRMMMKKD